MSNILHLVVDEFFVFLDAHSDDAPKSDSEKILYFYPDGKSEDDQLRSVGLCEALLSFSRFFSSPCTAVHTQNGKKFFHQISNHIWAVMSVCAFPPSGIQSATLDRPPFCEHSINDSVMLKALKNLCRRFELFHGQLAKSISGGDLCQTRAKLSQFFLNELSMLDLMSFDIVDWLDGLQFHQIDAEIFLLAENFIHQVEFSCPFPVLSALFFDNKLLWSSLPLQEMRSIKPDLLSTIFGLPPDLDLTTISPKANHMGRFLTGLPDLGDLHASQVHLPVIYRPDKSGNRFQVIVYQALRAIVCLFVEENQLVDLNFYRTFDKMFGFLFTEFATHLAASIDKQPSKSGRISSSKNPTSDLVRSSENGVSSPSVASLVFDSDLLSITSSLHTFYPNGGHRANPAAIELLPVITALREDILACRSQHNEVLFKLEPDVWILFCRHNNREVFITFTGKKVDLNAVLDESRQRLSSIFAGQLFV